MKNLLNKIKLNENILAQIDNQLKTFAFINKQGNKHGHRFYNKKAKFIVLARDFWTSKIS